MRRYWVPAALSSELPDTDCSPIRVRLLGEDLVAFRDSEGRLGLLEEFCAHRRASLYFGRNEEGGLRCAYHGWKYDVSGQCVDLPQQPAYAPKIAICSYPCVEAGDVVWAYMGPPELRPDPPSVEWATIPGGQRYVSKWLQYSNYLQGIEGAIDSSHVSFLHRYEIEQNPLLKKTAATDFIKGDPNPEFDIDRTSGGLIVYAKRRDREGRAYYRITQMLMPWFSFPPPFGQHPLLCQAWVPRDDESCMVWSISYCTDRALTAEERAAMADGGGINVTYVPGTFLPVQNRTNDYLLDRAAQKAKKTFSGVAGLVAADVAIQESMGAIVDRSLEHLVHTDKAVVETRRMMLEAARAHARSGTTPPGVSGESQRIRPGCVILRAEADVREFLKEGQLRVGDRPVMSV